MATTVIVRPTVEVVTAGAATGTETWTTGAGTAAFGVRGGGTSVRDLASAVAGRLGGRVGIAPRVFLKKLVADVLDRIDQFTDFDPRQHYALTVSEAELTAVERNAAAAKDVDDIELEP